MIPWVIAFGLIPMNGIRFTMTASGEFHLKDVLPAENFAFIHKIDDVLFSHAGLTQTFVSHFLPDHKEGIDDLIRRVNGFGRDELWNDASPIWTRPQNGRIEMY